MRWIALPALASALFLAAGIRAWADGDADLGKELFEQCSACHNIGKGARNSVGPHLNGIFGRDAGVIENFPYSKSMQRSSNDGLVWTNPTLDAYIENPKNLLSGTRMNFDGMKDPAERENLMAFLRLFSDNPSDIPEAELTASLKDHELDPGILALEGDPEYGDYLSSECTTCHRATGEDSGIPSITLWPEEDFVIAMHAYRRKLRPHPVMQMVAGRLSDEEIAALAAHFENLDAE